jgi:hypothetical protein
VSYDSPSTNSSRSDEVAAILSSGAFKSTSAAAHSIERFLTLIHLLIDQIIPGTAIRIQTGAVWAQPEWLRRQRSPAEIRNGKGALSKPLDGRKVVYKTSEGYGNLAVVKAPSESRIPCAIDQDAEVARALHDKIERESLFPQPLSDCTPTAVQDRPWTILFLINCSEHEGMIGASAVALRGSIFE